MRYVFLLAALAMFACEPEQKGPIKPRTAMATLEVQAVDLAGNPVAGALFMIQGRDHNRTDAEGRFHGFLEVKQGDVITFDVKPPKGYSKGPTSASRSGWQRKIHLPKGDTPIQLSFKADFKRPRQEFEVLARMDRPGISILVNAKSIAQTAVAGLARERAWCFPGERLTLRAGRKLRWEGTCLDHNEVYLLTPKYQGPISELKLQEEEDELPKGREGRELAKRLTALEAGEEIEALSPELLDRRELAAVVKGIKARVVAGEGIKEPEVAFIKALKSSQAGYLDGLHTLATQRARDKKLEALIPELKKLLISSRFKDDGELWFMLARAYEQQGDRAGALLSLERVERVMKGFSDAQKLAVTELHVKLLEGEHAAQAEANLATANLHLLKMAKARYEQLKALSPSDAGSIDAKLKVIEEKLTPKKATEKPAAEEKKPAAEEKKPAAEEKKPAAEEKKPAAEEKKPAAEEKKPAAEEKKPAAEEKKPEAEEKKPEAEEKKPEAEEKKPEEG